MKQKGFFKRWFEGMKNLTPEQQLQTKMALFSGGSFGLFMAVVTLVINKQWGFAIFVFCLAGLQIVSLIGTYQQYMKVIEYKDLLSEQRDDLKKIIEEAEVEK